MSIRAWTFHDDELLDEWPPYNDPTEPLWNLPRRVGYGGDQWGQFFEGSGMRRTWAVEDRSGYLIGRLSLRTETVLELPAGTLAATETRKGDRLEIRA